MFRKLKEMLSESYKTFIDTYIDNGRCSAETDFHFYGCGSRKYRDSTGFMHLIIEGVDVLKDKKAVECYLYNDGLYEYKDLDGKWYFIIDGIDMLEEPTVEWSDGSYQYEDSRGYIVTVVNNAESVTNKDKESTL